MNFFFDANMSHRYAGMIAGLCDGEHEVVHITRHPDFAANNVVNKIGRVIGNATGDIEYINVLRDSQLNWKIVSGDSDLIDTPHERAALIASQLVYFAMDRNWGKAAFSEQAWKLVKIWEELVERASIPGPAIYRVHMGRKLFVETVTIGTRSKGKTRS